MKLADVRAKLRAGGYGPHPVGSPAPAVAEPTNPEPAEVQNPEAPETQTPEPGEVLGAVGSDIRTPELAKLSKSAPAGVGVASPPVPAAVLLDRLGVAVRYVVDPADVPAALADLTREAALGPLGLDIETAKLPPYQQHPQAGLSPHLSAPRLVQVFDGGGTAYVFDVQRVGWAPLAPLWQLPMVAHNALFELRHLLHAGAPLGNLHCTMLRGNALDGGLPSLAALAQQHFGWVLDKGGQKADWNLPELGADLLAYAALDAVLAGKLYETQRQLLGGGQLATYERMRRAQPALARAMLAGVYFDLVQHQQLVAGWQREALAARMALQDVLGAGVNPDSPVQLAAWLEARLPAKLLAQWPRTKTGQLETGADALAQAPDVPVVAPLLAYKRVGKLLSTFGHRWADHVNPVTGRVHADFKLCTRAGRLSCERPNLQQIPRDSTMRQLFTAPPGRALVVADYSQVELRVAAILAGERAMLGAYERGEDLHRLTAAAVLGVDPATVTREQRQLAKAVNFGLLFGQGARGLAAYAASGYGVQLTEAEAGAARAAFFGAYPDLRRWQDRMKRTAEATKRATTPGGRVRDFTKEPGGQLVYTQALNTPVQGGAAEAMLEALVRLDEGLQGLDAQLVNVVHDELLVEASQADAPQAQQVLERAMVEGFLAVFPGACTRGLVEAHVGPNWAAAKG